MRGRFPALPLRSGCGVQLACFWYAAVRWFPFMPPTHGISVVHGLDKRSYSIDLIDIRFSLSLFFLVDHLSSISLPDPACFPQQTATLARFVCGNLGPYYEISRNNRLPPGSFRAFIYD